MAARLTPSRRGWATWIDDDGESQVHVKFVRRSGGRMEPTELFVRNDEGLTSDAMRRLPLSRMEAAANAPDMREALAAHLEEADDGAWHSLRPGDVPARAWQRATNDLAERLPFLSDDRPDERWHELPRQQTPDLKLDHSDSHSRPDAFYEEVAQRYSELAQRTRRPAVELAAANDVPVTTAHRWIKEARRRGFLAPGRRGTVG